MNLGIFAGMNWSSLAIAVVLGGALGWVMVRNQNKDYSGISILKRDDFASNMRKGQLIDIRKKEDFKKDKINGARNFKVSSLTAKTTRIRKDQAIYLYCQNGKKSKSAARKLTRKNYHTIYVLEGGLDAYNNK